MCGKDVTRYNEDIDFSDVDTQFVWISVMWIPSSSGYPVRLDTQFVWIRTFVWILIRPFVCSENFHQQVKENYKHWDFIRNVFGLFYFMFCKVFCKMLSYLFM